MAAISAASGPPQRCALRARDLPHDNVMPVPVSLANWPCTRARTLKAGCAADRATNNGEAGDWVDERGAGKEKARVGSLQLRRLVSLDAEAPESVGASQRLAWMLLGGVNSYFDVQIKIGSGCVLHTRQ